MPPWQPTPGDGKAGKQPRRSPSGADHEAENVFRTEAISFAPAESDSVANEVLGK